MISYKLLKSSSMLRAYLTAFFCVALAAAAPYNDSPSELNDRPIIGVLTMEVETVKLTNFGDYKSHIAASYVKFLEGSGARVVPILIYQSPSYYKDIVQKVNGIFFPGGLSREDFVAETSVFGNAVIPGTGYFLAGRYLYKYALEENQKGNYLPVWGTCLGFQMLSIMATGPTLTSYGIRKRCSSSNQMIPLEFTAEAENSRLFGNAPESILRILREENVTAHFHSYCITEETMQKYDLLPGWRVLSTNHDFDGMKFVSTIESTDYPFYGSIYHPEKHAFEWTLSELTPHNSDAIKTMQYFSNFFVDEARKSNNKYPSLEEEQAALIYHYDLIYTGASSNYEEVYFFQ